ncbi:MAG: four helix bundle protein [Flavobacteriales bacterium]|nr:four helix bundle protein [Flavobacteriales bacterium]
MHNFKQLDIWRKSQDLCIRIYEATHDFPKEEKFGLQSQIRRSAVSIPSNIAEGTSRNSNKEVVRFIEIALGSAYELETQLMIASRLKYLENSIFESLSEELISIIQMSIKFRKRLKS